MQIVILAAGQGTRLGDLSAPKCLVEVSPQKKYLSLQLDALKQFSFEKKLIVGGFGMPVLREFLQKEKISDLTIIENPDFTKANLYSLLVAKNYLTDRFFIFNADHYYSTENYKKIFVTESKDITVFCDRDRKLIADDMKVLSYPSPSRGGASAANMPNGMFDAQCAGRSPDGGAYCVQKIDKKLHEFDFGYVGVTCVPKEKMAIYWQAVARVEDELGDKAYVEAVIQRLAADGEKIGIQDISGSWWTEIDTPEDLERARKTIVSLRGA